MLRTPRPVTIKAPYELGIHSVDAEHAYLLELSEHIRVLLETEPTHLSCSEVLRELYYYAINHLKNEELLLDLSGWSGFEDHKSLHKILMASLEGIYNSFHTGEQSSLEALMDMSLFVHDWLVHHILKEDKKFAEHVKKYLYDKS